jgi:uncharacterized membrane protein YsdA (DUF1294 family)
MPFDIPLHILALYLVGINLGAYLFFWADKHYARRGAWRISEGTLLTLALLGGSPAAYIAMKKFRHKTKKSSFRSKFWIVITLQVLGLIYVILASA